MKKILLALIVGLTISNGLSAMMLVDFDLACSYSYIEKDTVLEKKIRKLSNQIMQSYIDYYEPNAYDLSSYNSQTDSFGASKTEFTHQFKQWKKDILTTQTNSDNKLQNLLVCLKKMREIEISLRKYQIQTDIIFISSSISANSFNKDRNSYIRNKKDLITNIASLLLETKTKSYRDQFLKNLTPESAQLKYAQLKRARFMNF